MSSQQTETIQLPQPEFECPKCHEKHFHKSDLLFCQQTHTSQFQDSLADLILTQGKFDENFNKLSPDEKCETIQKVLERSPFKPTSDALKNALELEIKDDLQNAKLTFMCYLSALTSNPMNATLAGESSVGKTWLQIVCAKSFPSESDLPVRERFILCRSFASPTQFYHETGEHDKDRGEHIINCFPHVYSFLDMPDLKLLDKMKTLLSHDKSELVFSYTDPNHNSKTVRMIGFPSVVYATTNLSMTSELSNRAWLVTPSRALDKNTKACDLVAKMEKDSVAFERELGENVDRRTIQAWTGLLLNIARKAGPFVIKIHDEQKVLAKFKQLMNDRLQSRSARDLSRIFALVKTVALFHGRLTTTDDDIDEAFEILAPITECNLKGISPAVWNFHTDVIQPLNMSKGLTAQPLERREIREKYRQAYNEPLDSRRYTAYIEALNHHGLVELVPDPAHRGWYQVQVV